MRKRGSAAAVDASREGPIDEADEKNALEHRVFTGTDCVECGRPQFQTPSGVTCANGHGGADPSTKPGFGHAPSAAQQTASAAERVVQHAQIGPSIRKASEPLAAEMKKNERDPEAWNVRARDQKRAPIPMRPDVERIVEHTFIEDVVPVYERLEASLKLGDRRTDYGSVMKALDEAESNARDAFKLWATASVEHEKWEWENRELFAGMRAEAQAKLQAEKDAKTRNKQITDADVDDMAVLLYPDEYAAQEVRRKRAKRMVDNCKNLLELWQSKCFSLRTQADKLR